MCGIAGIIHADGRPPDTAALDAMTDALAHRGPDGRGVRVMNGNGRGDGTRASAGLGHRRLAIVDLSERGAQPMRNEDGTLWLVMNGEIYNFRSLRAQLEDQGHAFSSDSDSEVALHAYEEWGPACAERLDGMFAFALFDTRDGTAMLCRDRFGKKPLHYALVGDSLYFASELGSLLRHPEVPRAVDPRGLSRFLLHEYVPAPHSIVAGAAKLPAAHRLVWQDGTASVERYWDIPFPEHGGADMPEAEALARLEDLLRRAVEKRLMSDVPLGVFLSGGLDSSAITAIMADIVPAADIRTFSIGFRERSFDETDHARAVARHLGTTHRERVLTPQAMLDILPDALDALSEPMADSSILPTFLLSRFTREHVTVALGGDGGDELLLGYDPFLALGPARLADMLPPTLVRLATRAAFAIPASERNMGLVFRVQRFLKGLAHSGCARQQAWLAAFTPAEQRPLLHPDILATTRDLDPLADVDADCMARRFANDYDRASYFYLRYYMAGHILAKVDQASMSNALEVRAPFLDTELATFLCALPLRLRLRRGVRKYLLRRLVAKHLPAAIAGRGKKGFGIPLAAWLRGPLRPLVEDCLDASRIRSDGFFDATEVRRLVDAHMSGRSDHRKELWTLVCFQWWLSRHFRP
ncbi:asparagine synthase (glutamine-hydrolysing) [Desulfobaculum xiamenense]|uniref:asparagine synthase (glutamine-hydrolyzing) n=1 Tax=Desulfobaculum xiamenense TaxID=995050 RepID=A0A846QPS1_9BACT|nr:asparagine synthase (glutamine-hydrolyzing) [Desulfobaculum xiamenense]NJB69177.1 asparagine synthase (glutamine-hydrolysing) [Desulfobaculum xiamenense]